MLKFADYIGSLPAPVGNISLIQEVETKLGISDVSKLFPMDGNDRYGDCTCAALAHGITIWSGLVGKKEIPTKSAVLALYKKLTGGVDQGCNMQDVVNFWMSSGFDGEKPLAVVSIDPKNHNHIKLAIQLFGGVYTGINVQENAQRDFSKGTTWTPGKLTGDGHAIWLSGYDSNNVEILTWGAKQLGTWAWNDCCVYTCFVFIPMEAAKANFAPGFNLTQLQTDLKIL